MYIHAYTIYSVLFFLLYIFFSPGQFKKKAPCHVYTYIHTYVLYYTHIKKIEYLIQNFFQLNINEKE